MDKVEKFNELLEKYGEEYYKCVVGIDTGKEIDLEKTYNIRKKLLKMFEEEVYKNEQES